MWTPSDTDWTTQREKDLINLRNERDRRLAESDYTQMPDWPGDPEPWKVYRQALRDLPEKVKNPAKPKWPDKPQ